MYECVCVEQIYIVQKPLMYVELYPLQISD